MSSICLFPMYDSLIFTEITEVNFFAFAYRLFHEDCSSLVGEKKYSTKCDSRTNLTYGLIFIFFVILTGKKSCDLNTALHKKNKKNIA